jgi:hypothetical protein
MPPSSPPHERSQLPAPQTGVSSPHGPMAALALALKMRMRRRPLKARMRCWRLGAAEQHWPASMAMPPGEAPPVLAPSPGQAALRSVPAIMATPIRERRLALCLGCPRNSPPRSWRRFRCARPPFTLGLGLQLTTLRIFLSQIGKQTLGRRMVAWSWMELRPGQAGIRYPLKPWRLRCPRRG